MFQQAGFSVRLWWLSLWRHFSIFLGATLAAWRRLRVGLCAVTYLRPLARAWYGASAPPLLSLARGPANIALMDKRLG
jgi:hypothetical protein